LDSISDLFPKITKFRNVAILTETASIESKNSQKQRSKIKTSGKKTGINVVFKKLPHLAGVWTYQKIPLQDPREESRCARTKLCDHIWLVN
jgi:hypothetical protein